MHGIFISIIKSYVIDRIFKAAKKHLNFNHYNLMQFAFEKQTTIRLGHKKIKLGPIKILNNGAEQHVFNLQVWRVDHKRFGDLTSQDAILDGFNSVAELRTELEKCYNQQIHQNTKITQIFLKPE